LLALINALRSGNTPAACSQLEGLVPVIQSLVPARITQSEATTLIKIISDAKKTIGCS
jgi:hypothetical protein